MTTVVLLFYFLFSICSSKPAHFLCMVMVCRPFSLKRVYHLLLWNLLSAVIVQAKGRSRLLTQQDRVYYKFVTRPDIDAPVFQIDVFDEDAVAPGYLFVAFYQTAQQALPTWEWIGPHIYDRTGELVWSGAPMLGYWNTYDFDTRTVNGEQMLTLWDREHKQGHIIDSSYRIHQSVSLPDGDAHAFNVFDNGKRALYITAETAYHTATEMESVTAVSFSGPCKTERRGIKEISLESSDKPKVLFEWNSENHISLNESTFVGRTSIEEDCSVGWDYTHINSVAKLQDDDYLISGRHTDAIYKVSHTDGSIIWQLGGTQSDFKMADTDRFSRQHDAQVIEQNKTHMILSVFDNGVGIGKFEKPTIERSRGLVFLLDLLTMRAEVVAEYKRPTGTLAWARGNFQTLPNGNRFFCWARSTYLSEHASDGTLLFEAMTRPVIDTYRGFKRPWTGKPSQPPDVHSLGVVLKDSVATIVHVSWNGDTRTVRWRFSEIDGNGNVHLLGIVDRQGFETRFEYEDLAYQVFAEAVDVHGDTIGQSKVATTTTSADRSNEESSSMTAAQPAVEQSLDTTGLVIAAVVALGVILLVCIRFGWNQKSRLLSQTRDVRYQQLRQHPHFDHDPDQEQSMT